MFAIQEISIQYPKSHITVAQASCADWGEEWCGGGRQPWHKQGRVDSGFKNGIPLPSLELEKGIVSAVNHTICISLPHL